MQFATVSELGCFLLGSAEVPGNFGWGLGGWAQLSPSGSEVSWSGCCCGENLLPRRSSVLHYFLLTVCELLLTRAAVGLGPFQPTTSLGRGPRPPPPSQREHLGAPGSRCLQNQPAPAQPCCFLLLLRAFLLHLNRTPCATGNPCCFRHGSRVFATLCLPPRVCPHLQF